MQKKLTYLVFLFLLSLTGLKINAQVNTVYDQLVNINQEWENQPDIDPLLKKLPAKQLTEQQLIQLHLTETEKLLRKRDISRLSADQQMSRLNNLDVLHRYNGAGLFPVNSLHTNRQPYFIDHNNTYCAAGYLMKESGADELARAISKTQNYSYLKDIQHPKLMDWVVRSGLTLDELALIQPGYPGDWPAAIMEFHYNNTGTDVNEYIEIHQSSGVPSGMIAFKTVLFCDASGTLYKTLSTAQMQTYTTSFGIVYYYIFPANESFADKGKIILKGTGLFNDTISVTTYTDIAVSVADYYPFPNNPSVRQFNVGESEATAVNTSLTYCGFYYDIGWYLQSTAATIGTQNPCTIMPIGLNKFYYTEANKKVDLSWETATELNNQFFIVERSLNGVDFFPIGKVPGAGNSSIPKQYSFKDNAPNYVNHYRLKQVNYDGSSAYSKILFVKVVDASLLSVLQNLVRTELHYQVISANGGKLDIYDISGRKVMSTIAKTGIENVNVSCWAPGKYIIRLYTADGQMFSQQFVKQ